MEAFKQFIDKNKGWLFGAAAGALVAILMLIIGFFPTLLILICATIGGLISAIKPIRDALTSWIKGLMYKLFGERF